MQRHKAEVGKRWPFGTRNNPFVSEGPQNNKDGIYRQKLANFRDIQYTGIIKGGGQDIKAIIDTGSFELLAFGVNCSACGSKKNEYDPSKSKHHIAGNFPGVRSGTAYAMEGVDMVEIGPLKVENQTFWEVYDANMPILRADKFHAIFGVGPPASAVASAKEEAKHVHKELEEYIKSGQKVTKHIKEIVEYYDQAAEHAERVASVVQNLVVANMSVCLGRASGSDGYFNWNDTATHEEPAKFRGLTVVGDVYWSASLTDVQAGQKDKNGKATCSKNECSAVIDTGTSLIAAPTDFVNDVSDMVSKWVKDGGNCDDVSTLPDLEFKLNGHVFTLPPDVGKVEQQESLLSSDNVRKFMPHLLRAPNRASRTEESSNKNKFEVLIMTIDANSQFGPLWIIGMPLFRE